MRHGKRINHLGRTASHRKAMLSNMAASLLVNKRINTTLAKAKELRRYVEPLITKAKNDTTHTRRVVFSYLQDKESVNALFNEVVDRVADRPGGYTRIIKLGSRLGDNAEMAMIELVDFNDLLLQEAEPKKAKTRRSRRGSKEKGGAIPAPEAKSSDTPTTPEAGTASEEEITAEAGDTADTTASVDAETAPESGTTVEAETTAETETTPESEATPGSGTTAETEPSSATEKVPETGTTPETEQSISTDKKEKEKPKAESKTAKNAAKEVEDKEKEDESKEEGESGEKK